MRINSQITSYHRFWLFDLENWSKLAACLNKNAAVISTSGRHFLMVTKPTKMQRMFAVGTFCRLYIAIIRSLAFIVETPTELSQINLVYSYGKLYVLQAPRVGPLLKGKTV